MREVEQSSIHHTGSLAPTGPRVELTIPADGNLELRISDPDGLLDIDASKLRASLYGIPVGAADLLSALLVTQVTSTSVTLRLGGTLPAGFPLRAAFSVQDLSGARSGATAVRPDR